ncbi:NETI motif-containing protein [Bacillus xiapuensis]|uniref:NETI motif-containing protein n=1 Tax=Bacillus xiapuensis TaxID=2014075 RepID=UPI000C23852C|nr:NETI motif-containing protein [Bacillus xiapuensis]
MSKKKFYVQENETIDQCLARMKEEGYIPVRRIEQPVFKKENVNGEMKYTPAGREIMFEGKKVI